MMIYNYYDIIVELFRKELRVRYKRLALGYVWSIASPMMFAFLYYIVFKKIMNVKTENYPLFLVVGLFPWQWLSNSIGVGAMTFVGNAPLIKKTIFPRYLIPFVVVLQDAFHFVISLPVVFVMAWFFNVSFQPIFIVYFLMMLMVQIILCFALNLFIATVNLFFRDLERIIQLVMTFMFYLTPVLYSEDMIPEKYHDLIKYHPFAPLFINWRHLFFNSDINLTYYLSSLLWSSGFLLLSVYVYKKLQWRFAEVL